MKKKVLAFLAITAFASAAYASCRTHTYMFDGQIVTCMTCCYGTNCNTTCF